MRVLMLVLALQGAQGTSARVEQVAWLQGC